MITQQQAIAWMTNGWQQSPYAKTLPGVGTGIDCDGAFGFQCVDWSRGYAFFLGTPLKNGNAITLWTVDQPGWIKTQTPEVGSVFVKNYVASDGVNYGHTGTVAELTDTGFYSYDQNYFNTSLTKGSPPARVFHRYNEVLGYLKSVNIGDVMVPVLYRDDVIAIWSVFMRTDVTEDDIKFGVGKTWEEYIKIIMGNPYASVQKSDVDNIWGQLMKIKPTKADYDYAQGKNYGKYLYNVLQHPSCVSVAETLPLVTVNGVPYGPTAK